MDNIEITKLHLKGYGYKKIAKELSLSPNTVKSYIKRHPFDGTEAEKLSLCPCCGKELTHIPHKRKKKFCSQICKNKWQNSHPKTTKGKLLYECLYCGTGFYAFPSKNQKYCSRACYDKARCIDNNE